MLNQQNCDPYEHCLLVCNKVQSYLQLLRYFLAKILSLLLESVDRDCCRSLAVCACFMKSVPNLTQSLTVFHVLSEEQTSRCVFESDLHSAFPNPIYPLK